MIVLEGTHLGMNASALATTLRIGYFFSRQVNMKRNAGAPSLNKTKQWRTLAERFST
jgi:hypothetical protein